MPKIFVISGGPGVGKTSVVNELEKKGFNVLKEAARELSQSDKRFKEKSILEINKKDFQDAILGFQIKQIKELEKNERENNRKNKKINRNSENDDKLGMGSRNDGKLKQEVAFSDRGLGDTFVYYVLASYKIPKDKFEYAKKFRYEKIFILDFLDFYEKDDLRKETIKEAEKIHDDIIKMYEKIGYDSNIITVPFMSVEKRADFILNKISLEEG
ncbi:MAG: ATP-binding protein [Nanoarchaeota archaeon]